MDNQCINCGNHEINKELNLGQFDLYHCTNCELKFIHPMPSAAFLKDYYDNAQWFNGAGKEGYENYDQQTQHLIVNFQQYLRALTAEQGPGRLLDIGCAYGDFLGAALNLGWEAHGVEPSDHARIEGEKRYGKKISFYPFVKDLKPLPFDLIILFDVIEHLTDPYQLFYELFSLGAIKASTKILLATPNINSWGYRKRGKNWEHLHPPSHLVYFSPNSMHFFLKQLKFKKVLFSKGVQDSNLMTLAEMQSSSSELFYEEGLFCEASQSTLQDFYREYYPLSLREDSREEREKKLVSCLAKVNALALYKKELELEALYSERKLVDLITENKWDKFALALLRKKTQLKDWLRVAYCFLLALRSSGLQRYEEKQFEQQLDLHKKDKDAALPTVLHIIPNFMVGGSSRLVLDLVTALPQYHHLILTSCGPEKQGQSVLNLLILRAPRLAQIQALLKRHKPVLIHFHYWGDCDLPWYKKFFSALKDWSGPVIQNVNTPVRPYEADFITRYIYVSRYVQQYFGRSGLKHQVIYPGSDFELFKPAAVTAVSDCIGMVYRLEKDKLNEQAIDVFIKVVQKRPQTKVLIVGGGSYLQPYQQAVAAAQLSENFEFTGYVDYAALPMLYARMKVFVAPVWKESFGQVSPFAMNMGIPVAGYEVGGLAEIVDDAALLAAPWDSEALAEIIINLLEQPAYAKEIGEKNQARAQALFSLEAMHRAYKKVYAELLQEPLLPVEEKLTTKVEIETEVCV